MITGLKYKPFTEDEQKFIRENYLLFPVKRVAKMLGRSEYGVFSYLRRNELVVPAELVAQRKKDSYIKKGNTPTNKGKKLTDYCSPEAIERIKVTQFKKGNLPFNTANGDGEIRDRIDKSGRAYKHIRVSLGKWVLYHRYVWEQVNGPIPKDHIIRFKDGNTMNCEIENLDLVSLKHNMDLNTIHRFPTELKEVIRLKTKINKKIHEKLNR